ncbi:regulator of G-protein signaling 8-like [Clavelina lepadiformis]|uniref:regulator of G-protein signaling 8-like n=1 Tax=Clavelina lepadiformis TaxID=159417 RepID=UPI00404226AC
MQSLQVEAFDNNKCYIFYFRRTCSVKTSKHTRNITMPVAIGSSDLFNFPLKRHRCQESDISFDLSGSYKNDTSIVQKKRRSDFHPLNALKSTKTTTSVQTLREFLKKKSQAMAFRAFLQKEFSEENLDFWTEVETYKKQKSSKQAKLAPVIYKTYIAVNAPKEINIDFSTRRNTTHNLQHPDNTTFDLAQERVYQLMERDSFRRFLVKEWKNENKVRKSSDKLKLPAKITTKSLTSKQEHKKSKSERIFAPEVDFSLMTEANNTERRKRKFSS